MTSSMVKTGASSILLGHNQYGGFFGVKPNMLLKITKKDEKHDECKHLDKVREISNYKDYYSIPEKESYKLKTTDDFYNRVIRLVQYEKMNIFGEDLDCYYINYAGDMDLQESIVELLDIDYSRIWRNHKDILKLTHQILKGLKFLHDQKICHLDIKPENIVINRETREFRIIDFGFSSMEPFHDFLTNPRGTPGYIPKHLDFEKPSKYLPKIEANDFKLIGTKIPMMINPKLVYKVDSYCLGRVIHFLTILFDENYISECYNWYGKSEKRLKKIMNELLENDVNKRITIKGCLEKYF